MPSTATAAFLLLALAGCAQRAPLEPALAEGPHHILTILAVQDLEASTAFYAAAFGWPLRVDAPMFKELALPDGRGLGLYDRVSYAHNIGDREPVQLPAGAVSPTELYFHVPDLGAAIAKLETAGATELSARAVRPWGDEAAYYADPDGNVLVVATPTE